MDWLACVPVYTSLAEIDEAMRKAIDEEAREEEMQDNEDYGIYGELAQRDVVLSGLCAYLAQSYPEPLKEMIYSILDLYCGMPFENGDDFFARRDREKKNQEER